MDVQSAPPCGPHAKSIAFCSTAVGWSERHTQKSEAASVEERRSTAATSGNDDDDASIAARSRASHRRRSRSRSRSSSSDCGTGVVEGEVERRKEAGGRGGGEFLSDPSWNI